MNLIVRSFCFYSNFRVLCLEVSSVNQFWIQESEHHTVSLVKKFGHFAEWYRIFNGSNKCINNLLSLRRYINIYINSFPCNEMANRTNLANLFDHIK